jgi:hypothetical protein
MTLLYTLIKTSVFPGVTDVRLYPEVLEHIRNEHPEVPIELPSIYSSIERTIIAPTHIQKSYKNSFVFMDVNTTNASGDPFRIPVRLVEGTSGRITTALFAAPPSSAIVIWRGS